VKLWISDKQEAFVKGIAAEFRNTSKTVGGNGAARRESAVNLAR
jgi:hypothetical protein